MFSKKKLHETKLLLERSGKTIDNKFAQPFVGFEGCYTIITCNHLPYPFVPPANSSAGFNE